MNRYTRIGIMALVLGAALWGVGARPAAARGALAAPSDPIAVVHAFLAAFNAADLDTARTLVAPGLHFTFDAGTPLAQDYTLEQFMAQGQPTKTFVTETSNKLIAPDTVYEEVAI